MSQSGPTATPGGAPATAGPSRISARLMPLLQQAAAASLTDTELPTPRPSATPQRLRQLQVLAMVAMLVLGAVGFIQLLDLRTQLVSAPELTQQYVRLTAAETHLVEAGNQAALRSLGADPTDVEGQLHDAATLLVNAAAQRPADQEVLAELSASLTSYSALLLQTSGSAQLLAKADTLLDQDLMPQLEQLRASLANESVQRAWSYNAWIVWAAAAFAAAALIWISVSLARLNHRAFNPGLAAAIIAIAVIAALGSAGVAEASAADSNSRVTQFTKVVALGDGQLEMSQLRRSQTRAVVNTKVAAAAISDQKGLLDQLQNNTVLPTKQTTAALSRHRSVTTSLAKSAWSEASKTLTAKATQEATSAFTSAVDAAAAKAVTAAAQRPTTATSDLTIQAFAVLLLALLGAGAAYWGVALRLKEYR